VAERGGRDAERGGPVAERGGRDAEREIDWDALASLYDRQLGLERRALHAALDLAAPAPEDVLLDVGTGTGAVLRALAARPGRPRRALGVDPSAAMLARVGPLPEGWELVRADGARLPLDDASVDVALAAYVLHVAAAPEALLAELARALRPGGRLVVVTPRRSGALAHAGAALAARFPRRLGGLRPLDPRPALTAAGFALVAARATGRGYPSLVVLARAAR